MKKVLIVVNYMNMGGIENFVMNILRNIDLTKFSVDFLYSDGRKSYFDDEIESYGCNIFRITGRSTNIRRHLSELKSFFKKHKDYNAVHINYDNATCFTVARAAKKVKIPNIIAHSHNSSADNAKLHKICRPLLCHYANVFWSCSDKAAKWMFTKKTNKTGKVVLIKNAIDTEKYVYNENYSKDIRNEFGLDDAFVVGHVGRFNLQKNHKFLIDVFNEFHKINNKSSLLLVGDGELNDDIKSYVHSLNLDNRVIFAGIRDDVPKLLCAMDCFVMPSLFEGLPVTLVETQASGLRSITSDVVTKDVEISDLLEYYSLDKSVKDWAEQIKSSPTNRIKYIEDVKKSGFDIQEELKKIVSVYVS